MGLNPYMINCWQLTKKETVIVFSSVQNSFKSEATWFVKISGHKTKQNGMNVGKESIRKKVEMEVEEGGRR